MNRVIDRSRGYVAIAILASYAANADVREHTRLTKRNGTAISSSQAIDLTLTTSEAAVRPVQIWLRTAGTLDQTGQNLSATIASPDADLLRTGQRVRAFSLASRSSMYQGRVTRVVPQPGGARIEIGLASKPPPGNGYLVEVVTELGEYLSVPNEAIIEEGNKHIVYLKLRNGDYTPREIEIDAQGELYTRVVSGLQVGDQVVTTGSFFIDAEHKMKGGGEEQ